MSSCCMATVVLTWHTLFIIIYLTFITLRKQHNEIISQVNLELMVSIHMLQRNSLMFQQQSFILCNVCSIKVCEGSSTVCSSQPPKEESRHILLVFIVNEVVIYINKAKTCFHMHVRLPFFSGINIEIQWQGCPASACFILKEYQSCFTEVLSVQKH